MHENTCCLWNSDIITTSKALHEYCTPKEAFLNKPVDKVTLKDQVVDIIQSTNPVKIHLRATLINWVTCFLIIINKGTLPQSCVEGSCR